MSTGSRAEAFMDVRCGRCATEYEFDDALISERGTTVKCTSCAFQFRVFPPTGSAAPELWRVQRSTGKTLTYTSLRELQRAISVREVGPADYLTRGDGPPRPLGAIAELEGFFARPPPESARTLHGVAPVIGSSHVPAVAEPREPSKTRLQGTVAAVQVSGTPDTAQTAERARRATRMLGSPSSAVSAPESEADGEIALPLSSSAIPVAAPIAPADVHVAERAPLPRQSLANEAAPPPLSMREPPPSSIRDSFVDEEDPESRVVPHHRSATSRWIAAMVLLGVCVLLAATVGKKYLARFTGAATTARAHDTRVATFVEQARRALDDGDFDTAKEALDKASALSDADPDVTATLARWETLRADVAWLKVRLLEGRDAQVIQAAEREVIERIERARRAVARATALSPSVAAVQRSRVDLARISGQLPEARRLVSPIAEHAHLPENAYVLAALDLAEATPVWTSVIERLRTAASAERDLGRAHVALVYALARAGQSEPAALELEKIRAQSTRSTLLAELTEYVGSRAPKDVASVADAGVAALDAAISPLDSSAELRHATLAFARGDLAAAEGHYRAVVSRQPDNSEALAGLADVAQRRGETGAAAALYDRVIASNPSYVPALIARADQKWQGGDRNGASVLYRRALERTGQETSYGKHAAQRLEQAKNVAPRSLSGAASEAQEEQLPTDAASERDQ